MKYSARKLFSKITGFDLFGSPVMVNFEGAETYTSYLSSIVSIGLMVLMAFNLVQLTIGYRQETKHGLKTDFVMIDRLTSEPYYISENQIEIAVFTEAEEDSDFVFSLWQKHPCGFDVKHCPLDEYLGNLPNCSADKQAEIIEY